MNLRTVRYITWAAVALVLVVAAVLTWRLTGNTNDGPGVATIGANLTPDGANGAQAAGEAAVTIGGPFALVDDTGAPITEAAFTGQPSMIFFGFTHCPDVCPTSLAEAGVWLDALGEEGDAISVFFVTVDPERDTVAAMSAYLSVFDPRITGITGPVDDVHAMLDSYRVVYEKLDTDENGNYNMQHTASFYLLDAEGNFDGIIGYDEGQDAALQKIRALIAES
ncbi:MAG: SCO family protein [Bauldia sp.]|nr:SCO family protein [Bauldia sp.]